MKNMSHCILLLFLFSSLLHASGLESWLGTVRHSQFPLDSLNTPEAQVEDTDRILQEPISDLLAGGPSHYESITLRAVYASRICNAIQKLLNTKANDTFFAGIPFMIHPATRKFGAGLWCAALGLKIHAAFYLPHLDEDLIQYRLHKIHQMDQSTTDAEQFMQSLQKKEKRQQQQKSPSNGPNESV